MMLLSGGLLAVELENDSYRLEQNSASSISVRHKASGLSAVFTPQVTVFFGTSNPNYVPTYSTVPDGVNIRTSSWNGDMNYFHAPDSMISLVCSDFSLVEDKIVWNFPSQTDFDLMAEVELGAGTIEPKVTVTMTPKSDGYYSVGFTGAPAISFASVEWVWQPLIWQGKRFPQDSYLTAEFQSPIPGILMGYSLRTVGVTAAAEQMPFRLPTRENSLFGGVLRNASGYAQPMVFAPIYGGPESYCVAGNTFTFGYHFFVRPAGWYDTYRHLASNLYGFRDYRENARCSINQTLDNMVDFVMNATGNNYSYWYPEEKTYGYQQDAPGTGRQQSAVYALSLALVRDSREIYEQRSLPTIEYMLSRNSYSIQLDGSVPYMGGPTSYTEEWCALSLFSKGQCYAFSKTALDFAGSLLNRIDLSATYSRIQALNNAKDYLRPLIAMYRMTGSSEYLDKAQKVVDDYIYWRIDQEPVDYTDVDSSFWIEIGPIWDALEQFYNDTNDPECLRATVAAIRQRTAFNYLTPPVPDTMVTVDGETVPAWWVSSTGLNSEAGGTAHSHRGIFMAPYAGPMLRMAHHSGDAFLKDIARSAVVGRYANYPGYTYRDRHRLEFGREDYPLRWYEDYVNTAHFNHPLPICLFTIDFLVSDFYERSEGAIHFPAQYSSTSAYFRGQVYGDRPGTFYGHSPVRLWLPKALVTIDNIQVNYLAGYGNGKLYLAFSNSSDQPIAFEATLNPSLVRYGASHNAAVWRQNAPAGTVALTEGRLALTISAKGITAVAVDDIEIESSFQKAYRENVPFSLSASSYRQNTTASFGKVTAMILSVARPLASAYVWLTADRNTLTQAVLHYTTDGSNWQQAIDTKYPFEFTVPLEMTTKRFICYVEGVRTNGLRENASEMTLDVFQNVPWDCESLDFGVTSIGNESGITERVLIYNDTPDPLTFTSAIRIAGENAEDFSLDAPAVSCLEAGESVELKLTFRPRAAGAKTARLEIHTDYPSRPVTVMTLTGRVTEGILYVAPDGDDENSGDSWAQPLASVSAAVARAAQDKSRIWVKAGVYDLTDTIYLNRDVQIFGGFEGIEQSPSQRRQIHTLNRTVLQMTVPQKCILQMNGVSSETVIDGLTLTHAQAGALKLLDSTPTLRDCRILYNYSAGSGAGIYIDAASGGTFIDCFISGNKTDAADGGGIYFAGSYHTPVFRRCTISNNTSVQNGGGLYSLGSFQLEACTFADNTVRAASSEAYGGGAICVGSSSAAAIIDRCLFLGNTVEGASGRGGGGTVLFRYWSNAVITNSVFCGNWMPGAVQTRGSALYFRESNAPAVIRNCTFADNHIGTRNGACINVRSGAVSLINTILSGNTDIAFWVWNNGTSVESANLYYDNGSNGSPIADPLYAASVTGTWSEIGSFDADPLTGRGTSILTAAGTPFAGLNLSGLPIRPNAAQKRQALILSNTASSVTVEGDVLSEYGVVSGGVFQVVDYHECSEAGRFNPASGAWETDGQTSPAIDSGDALYDWSKELWPHGKRINKGAYGGTPQASMSLSLEGRAVDLNLDEAVNVMDLLELLDQWLRSEVLLAEDLNRDGFVDMSDFALLAEDWLED
jgi:hypothetical protein